MRCEVPDRPDAWSCVGPPYAEISKMKIWPRIGRQRPGGLPADPRGEIFIFEISAYGVPTQDHAWGRSGTSHLIMAYAENL